MTFADTLQFLFSLGPELKTVKWDLARISTLLAEFGSPQRNGRFIHVAGTNGKGSVCAMLESALRAAGLRTGLYTSPHLVSPRERIRIAGESISEREWTSTFGIVHAAAERLLASGAIESHPSFFETMTAMAFLAFEGAELDYVVLETGLGGRLDATNVVEPKLSAITPIDFDHEAFLGSSIQSIAAEKAGILKKQTPAVFAAQRPEALDVLERRARELAVPVRHSSSLRCERLTLERFGSRFTLIDTLAGGEQIEIECPLAGEHQVENARTAAAVLRVLGIETGSIRAGIARAQWPGRLERISRDPDIILDGAHNPAGARALAAHLRRFYRDEPLRLVYGAMRDKAVEEITGELFPIAREVIATAIGQPRALSPESLIEMSDHPRLRAASGIEEALRMTRAAPMTTFITGSLFLVGEARALLTAGAKES